MGNKPAGGQVVEIFALLVVATKTTAAAATTAFCEGIAVGAEAKEEKRKLLEGPEEGRL